MATINKTTPDVGNRLGATPWGNVAAFRYTLETDSAGKVIQSDGAAALGAGDTVRLGTLPAGYRYVDPIAKVTKALTATTTATVGFAYKDGVDDSSASEGAAAFVTGITSAVGVHRGNVGRDAPLLQKDAWLTITTAVAAQDAKAKVEIVVLGIAEGVR